MSTQRYISTSFWTDKWIRSLDSSERYLYMYLLTNPQTNISGIYQITLDRIAFDTGYDERTLIPMFERFKEAGKAAFIDEEWIILPSWPKHQKWEVKETIRKGIETALKSIPHNVLHSAKAIGYTYPIDTLLVGYQYSPSYLDSDIDIDTDTDTDTDNNPDPEEISPSTQKPYFSCNDSSTRIEALRKIWNESGLPEMRRNILTFTQAERTECLATISVYSNDEIEEAMHNYKQVISEPEYDLPPQFQYKSFQSFIGKGVEKFSASAKPFEVYKKRTGPPGAGKKIGVTDMSDIEF